MMLSSLTMLILGTTLHHIFNQVNSAGLLSSNNFPVNVPRPEYEENFKILDMSSPSFDHKFESLVQIVNKMDESIQSLQDKTHTWAIFQHHIESWNDGIRILENKLDLLKRTHEEQQQQLDKLELSIEHVIEKDNSIRQEIKHSLKTERDIQMVSSSKLNSILRHIQSMQMDKSVDSSQTQKKNANVIAPVNSNNVVNKIDQRLNTILHQMAQQRDLKQLHSLEKRNSKSLEGLSQLFSDALDKQEEFTTRLQRSNECCYSLSNELTTFTESSDILLKRIEKIVRNVSEKLNQIEQMHKSHDEEDIEADNEDVSTVHTDSVFSDEENSENEDGEMDTDENADTETESSTKVYSANHKNERDQSFDTEFHDNLQEVEFLRPTLKGCHELLLDTSAEDDIDGIYKFQTPEINEKERDFNERFCVYPMNNGSDVVDGLPWTVIQHRGPYKQQENFNRSWSDYRNGFGYLYRDFWFGNDFIHRLVYSEDYELRIELEDFNGTKVWAEYATFRIDSEQYNYNLLIAGYRGTVPDAMKYHNEKDFSTYDRRNDRTVDACCSCAVGYASGWWFDNCSEANLNGVYHDYPSDHNYVGIMWELWHGDYSLKATRMMIRPNNLSTSFTSPDSSKHVNSEEQREDP